MRAIPATCLASLKSAVVNGQTSAGKLLSFHAEGLKRARSLNALITEVLNHLRPLQVPETLDSSRGDSAGKPLLGRYFAVKDNFCTKDVRTTCGSKMLENFTPTYNATVVQRLLNAGGILVGKTNMDEFGMGSGSIDSVFGPVKNPWNARHIAGGSSGGSAVAVAAGAAQFAIGSDTGGSVRNPAGYCGIVGFKPSYGTVSRYGLISLLNSSDVPSIFSRDAEEAEIIFDVISGWDPKDSTTFRQPLDRRKLLDLRGIKIGIPKEYNVPELSTEMRECWMSVADEMEKQGATVIPISLPHSEYSNACYTVLNACDVASNMARFDGIEFGHRSKNAGKSTNALYAATRHEGFNEVVRGRILAGNFFLLRRNYKQYFVRAAQLRRLIAADFSSAFEAQVDIILAPVTLTAAPTFEEFSSVDNRTQQEVQDLFTVGSSLAGLPAITVPIAMSKLGLPLSMQLIASFRDDYFLLDVARSLQKLFSFSINQP